MTTTIRKSQIAVMKSFDNLFIELSAKNCNQKCQNCYIDFPQFKKVEDFIDITIIENAINDLKNTDIKCIYLTGAEPMTHPDFNTILRMCLKMTNVCICTNGSFINEKKARFLKKVEGESNNEIIFQISMDYFEEVKNDDIRYRGAYRHAIFAIKNLVKYNFIPIISVTNFYNENEKYLSDGFYNLLKDYGIDKKHILIRPNYSKNSDVDFEIAGNENCRLDCQYGRILTAKGIYSCPFLANDYRGRCGSSFIDFAQNVPLETDFCQTCQKSQIGLFGINFTTFC